MIQIPSPLKHLHHPTYDLWIKRDDLIHPIICGNKRRKISGYLQTYFPDTRAKKTKSATDNRAILNRLPKLDLVDSPFHQGKNTQQYNSITTFGGAYSNHLRAIAHTGALYDIPTIGIVRGDELASKHLNTNLQFCQDQGMQLHFVDRATYRNIKTATNTEKITPYMSIDPSTLVIPEGGRGPEGITGTHDIIKEIATSINMSTSVYLCIEAGTGTTAAGCIQAIQKFGLPRHTIIIPVLHDLPTITQTIATHNNTTNNRYTIIPGYEHGGYAKTTPKLLSHNHDRSNTHHMPIEPTYSGKLMYAIDDLISKGYFPSDATIVIYHSGY